MGRDDLVPREPEQPRRTPERVDIVIDEQDAAGPRSSTAPLPDDRRRLDSRRCTVRAGGESGRRIRSPCPGLRSSRDTRPPCISVSSRTSVRPIPSPPWDRSIEESTWANISKTLGSISGAMPMPVSLTRKTTSPPSGLASIVMCPPSSLYFAALFSRLARTCSSRVGSPAIGIGPGGDGDGQSVPAAFDERAHRLDRPRDDRRGVEAFRAELDLPACDPRDVEQVVDESHEVLELAVGDIVGPASDRHRCAPESGTAGGQLLTVASGFLSSWASTARNSSLRRSASLSWDSTCFRSEMSRMKATVSLAEEGKSDEDGNAAPVFANVLLLVGSTEAVAGVRSAIARSSTASHSGGVTSAQPTWLDSNSSRE